MPTQPPLIRALLDPARYDHPVTGPELIETHISWVLLTGCYAYKVKKPVDLGFLDFSTLEQRHHYCEEELRINRRTAPDLYLEVVPITGPETAPVLGGTGPAMEYAVRMVQFPQERLLDRMLARGAFGGAGTDALARVVAAFHAEVAVAGPETDFGDPDVVCRPVRENFRGIRERLGDGAHPERLAALEAWSGARWQDLRETFAARKRDGFVRECHGDLHLGNIAELDGRMTPFDGIEFDPYLRWIDCMSEVAFLTMDLEDRGRDDLAARFRDAYLAWTGDYAGLALLPYYLGYRAMVRAKVAAIRLGQEEAGSAEAAATREEYEGYLALAERYTRPLRPALLLTRGPSGSGKTTLTQPLLERLHAVRVRSDVERKRLFGLSPEAGSGSAVGAGIYNAEANERTYRRLEEAAEAAVTAGYPAIVDATFLDPARRTPFAAMAERLGVPYAVLDFRADPAVLRQRVTRRQAGGRDASEADTAVLERQLAEYAPLAGTRGEPVIPVATERPGAAAELIAAVEARLEAQARR